MDTPTHIDLDDVLDAHIKHGEVHLLLRNGDIIRLPYTRNTLELYWRIKIRNRRRAFGL